MNIWEIGQLIGGILLSIGYIPQIKQILKTKSTKDLNIKFLIMVFLGIALMEPYAIDLVLKGSGLMFLITNTISTILAGLMLILKIYFRNEGSSY